MTWSPDGLALTLSDDDRARMADVDGLAQLGASGIELLLAGLGDRSWAVRRAVVHALAKLGEDAVPGLTKILRERDTNENRLAAAVDALSASSADVTDAALALCGDAELPETICDGIQVLGRVMATRAIPRLAAFTSHPNDNVAVAAIEALGRIGGPETVEALIGAIETRHFFRTFPAIDVLGRTGDPRAVEPLVSLLEEPMYASAAVRALGHSGQAIAVPWLGKLCSRGADASVRMAAAALADLVELHESRYGFTPALRAALDDVSLSGTSDRMRGALAAAGASERIAIAKVLGWLGDESAVVALIDLLEEEATREAAAGALRRLGAKANPLLVAAIRMGDSAKRERLLPLLGHGGFGAESLAACLSDREPAVRALACEALARRGDTALVPMIFRLIGDPNPRVSQAASAAIHSLGSLETKKLALEEARSSDVRVRRAALRILGYFGYPEALELLIEAMNDEDERSRESAIAGLPLIDDPRARQALVAAAGHAEAKSRASAMRALGQTSRSEPVVAVLRAGVHDPDPWVRYYACQSLAKLKVDGITEALVHLMDDEAGQVRVGAVEALAQIGDELALSALSRAASSTDDDISRAALVGLGIARDPRTIPLVRDALASVDPSTRLVAVSVLAEFDAPEVVPLLARAASDPDQGVRNAAVGFLSTRPGLAATQALVDKLGEVAERDKVIAALAVAPEMRAEGILIALETADHERARFLISALLRGRRAASIATVADVLHSQNPIARRAAVEAIASINTKDTIEVLRRATSDSDAEVRRIAIMALRD